MWAIEPVPHGRHVEALTLVAGGGLGGREVSAGLDALRGYLSGHERAEEGLWWAREGRLPVAAALVIRSPGRTAGVLHSTAEHGVVPPEALSALLAAMARQSLGPELLLMQGLLPPRSRRDAEAFERAGFKLLAELIYMRRDLRTGPAGGATDAVGLEFRRYGPETHADFAAAIQASYEDSLDCPALGSLRSMEDVLKGHKASGVFRPDLWTVACEAGVPAGVVLLNQSVSPESAEVVYMGVGRRFRGRGYGRLLLERAVGLARAGGFTWLTLAVDSMNHRARRLYDEAGFVETDCRLAYMITWDDAGR